MKSGYYNVGLHPLTRCFVGIKWDGMYYVYTCLPSGLSIAHWVFSKVMTEMGMHWRRCGIRNLPHILRWLLLSEERFPSVSIGGNTIEGDCLKAGLQINFPKSGIPMEERRHLDFDADHSTGYFIVPADR